MESNKDSTNEMEVEEQVIGDEQAVEEPSEEERMLDEYSNLIELISTNPFKLELHLNHIKLTKELGLRDELNEAREMFIQYFLMDDSMWFEWIEDKKSQLLESSVEDLNLQMELIELYKRSLQDYLSIPLLISYSEYFINNFYASIGLTPPPSEEEEDVVMDLDRKSGEPNEVLATLFNLESVRSVRDEVLKIGGGHLSESSKLWDIWRRFELDDKKTNDASETAAIANSLYLSRLAVPHMEIESTFSEYSSFVTKFYNQLYNKMLPEANKIYTKAKAVVELREFEERKLKKAKHSEAAYLAYLSWELSVKTPAIKLVTNLFERAIKDFSTSLQIWELYLDFFNRGIKPNPDVLPIVEKAVKSVPQSGSLWAIYLRAAERNELGAEAIDQIFSRALSSGLLNKQMEELILIVEARAGYYRRVIDSILESEEDTGDEIENAIEKVFEGLVEGLNLIAMIGNGGDPQLRLEKHLIRMYERFSREAEASNLWASITAARPESYSFWYARAEFETRHNNLTTAHQTYVEASNVKNLDFPEYLLQLWLEFERQNGTLVDLEFTISRIAKLKKGLEARRAREAQELAQSQPIASTSTSTTESISEPSIKRERSPVTEIQPPPKRAKTEQVQASTSAPVQPVKRDRENSTVFIVAPVEAELEEAGIRKLFKDCGAIRECTLKSIAGETMGMVEFMDKESVGAAQTKDKKKINDTEVAVFLAWKSCLFVTNFPQTFDKAAVENLFSKFGTIFDTRWPSKTYKDTRRFCYVQFTSPDAAQAALELHGTTLDNEGIKLIVYISDPGRKKSRTDAGANNKELYVQGLSKFVKEADLRKLFEEFGAIKGIRVVMDEKDECKGFAFVEFEDEVSALKSLELNNFELKKRRMSVVIAQSRAAGVQNPQTAHKGEKRYEVNDRSLKVRGIVPGTQEAIVQQAFEKFAKVKVVKMVEGETEAEIEFENAAEVGKILLIKDTITIEGVNVEIFASGTAQSKKSESTASTSNSSTGSNFMPRQASRSKGRVGLAGSRGRGRGGIGSFASSSRPVGESNSTPATGEASSASTTASGSAKSQDDFRALMNKKA